MEQPGASKPQSQGGPDETISEADVEKTLEKLETMTSTLVQEIGKPPSGAASPESAAPPAAGEPVAPAAEQPAQSAAPDVQPEQTTEPAAAKPPDAPLSPEVEVEQELNQAIQQLQGGNPVSAAARPPRPGLLRQLMRIVDLLFLPLALVIRVLDLPSRWLPGIVRQLLGYVAVGTALMAAALWVYLLVLRT